MADHLTAPIVPPGMTPDRRRASHAVARLAAFLAGILILAFPASAHASLLPPELEDKLATILALFVLFVVPVVLIVLFWLVHILPEQIAHKRHHPQFEAIRTLCLLSLVFGGLLWPLAWIWAYSKPVLHKLAYGTDKLAHGEEAAIEDGEPGGLQERLARLEARGVRDADLKTLRADLDALEARLSGEGR
jgi:CBS domain containing-hemolysin-like protein